MSIFTNGEPDIIAPASAESPTLPTGIPPILTAALPVFKNAT